MALVMLSALFGAVLFVFFKLFKGGRSRYCRPLW